MLTKIIPVKAVRFIVLFLLSYFLLYMVNYTLTGLLQPGGYYLKWLDDNLDYVTGFRTFLLSTTSYIMEWRGYETFLGSNILWVKGGHNIRMVYSCMGINVLCLWWAFLISYPMSIKRKLKNFVLGTVGLILLNITRLSLLTISPADYSFREWSVDHHTLYNVIAYGVIMLGIKRVMDKKVSTKGARLKPVRAVT